MKGFVPTPPALVDRMVARLFRAGPPSADSTVLDPGCGSGVFVEGILRWCQRTGAPVPRITAVDSDPARVREARTALAGHDQVRVVERDFLLPSTERYDYIIGNPPYVSITGLDADERARYRERFRAASGRFDLYLLFFEQALRMLSPTGRLVFVTPEKYLYVQSAAPARRIMAEVGVEEVELIDEQSFPGLITYPAITTIARQGPGATTRFVARDGSMREVALPGNGDSWLAPLHATHAMVSEHFLEEAFTRISCGVATGADEVFVMPRNAVPPGLEPFALPTLSGRELVAGTEPTPAKVLLVPYGPGGELLPEHELGALRDYLDHPERRARLEGRSCVARKPWYAFHETPPLEDLRRPKILCKDITARPWFVPDLSGEVVPRHSVYYLVPRDPDRIHELCDYLNSREVTEFLQANCQRAANGFLRLQSHVLKRVPIPPELVAEAQLVPV